MTQYTRDHGAYARDHDAYAREHSTLWSHHSKQKEFKVRHQTRREHHHHGGGLRLLSNVTWFEKNRYNELNSLRNSVTKQSGAVILTDSSDTFLAHWNMYKQTYCRGKMDVISNILFSFTNIFIHSSHFSPQSGNNTDRLLTGFFELPCIRKPAISFLPEMMYIPDWYESCITKSRGRHVPSVVKSTFTIALSRFEHLNVYWTIMDIYDTFLTMKLFNEIPEGTVILLLDSHPISIIDGYWSGLFSSVIRLADISTGSVLYKHLVWNIPRTKSPMLQKNESLPYQSQFRHFVLTSFNVNPNYRPMCNVQQCYNILLIWRHDYIPYNGSTPRRIKRKFSNEEEMLSTARRILPHSHIQGVQLDQHSLYTQLSLLSTTDIIIGMHGAALSYALLLPQRAVLVEIFPLTQSENWHMEYIARWSHVHYIRYRNEDYQHHDFINDTTSVPADVIETLIREAIDHICDK